MTDDQKEPIREAKRHCDRLRSEAERLSWGFPSDLGATLRTSPENVVFESQTSSVDVRYYTPSGHSYVYADEEGSGRVIALTDEFRSALLRLADLMERVSTTSI